MKIGDFGYFNPNRNAENQFKTPKSLGVFPITKTSPQLSEITLEPKYDDKWKNDGDFGFF